MASFNDGNVFWTGPNMAFLLSHSLSDGAKGGLAITGSRIGALIDRLMRRHTHVRNSGSDHRIVRETMFDGHLMSIDHVTM